MTQEEYDAMQKKAIEQLMSGKSLTGKDGVFAPLLKQFLETALEAEMEEHLDEKERAKKNKRNGKGKKTLKTSTGEVPIETPQDRQSSFEPQIIKKRETILAESLTTKILSLYGMGMSLRDISKHIEEMYDTKVSAATLSQITDKVIPEIKQWQSRPLEAVYPIVWLDAMHFKVKEEGKISSKAIYTILGITIEGKKDLLGIYLSESESANFWLSVLTDLNNRGVEDILIASIDNLKGFVEAIQSIYPKCEVQTCIIHQIRNSLKYVASKNQKEFMKDLKLVYKADTRDLAETELDTLEEKWGSKYPIVIKSWRNNWNNLTTYFDYTPDIRRLIYTTNAVEGFHRQIRKVTKTKGPFTSDMALIKIIYLASLHIMKKWTSPLQNWALTVQQLKIRFGDRLKLDLDI
jgi:transposase-like protein